MSSDWCSADTLRDGGVLMIDDDSAVADGSEPAATANPRTPYSERPVARARRAKAHELIERLVAEGRVRITDPDDDEVTELRRVVNYAKRHGLEPAGKRIEKVSYGGPGLELFLADGPHPDARSQRPKENGGPVPVPSRLGNLHPIVTAVKDDDHQLVMPSGLRRRSILLLQGLSAEAVRRGYEVRKAHSCFHSREGGVDIVVDSLAYTASLRQEFPQSTDPDRSSRLVVELVHGLTGRPGRRRGRKTRVLEEALDVVLGEIEVRAAQDARRRQEEQRAIVEREVRWRAAVEVAKEQAAQWLRRCVPLGCVWPCSQCRGVSPPTSTRRRAVPRSAARRVATVIGREDHSAPEVVGTDGPHPRVARLVDGLRMQPLSACNCAMLSCWNCAIALRTPALAGFSSAS